MPRDISSVVGYRPAEAIRRLVCELLLDASSLADLADGAEFSGVSDSDGMLLALAAVGRTGRIVRIAKEELLEAGFPAIAQLRNDNWILLQGQRWSSIRMQDEHGTRRLPLDQLWPQLSGRMLIVLQEFPCRGSFIARMKSVLLQDKGLLVKISLASILMQGCALVVPWLTAVVIGKGFLANDHMVLKIATLGILSFALFQAWTGWLREMLLISLTTRFEMLAARGVLEHLLLLPFPFIQRKTLGDLLEMISGVSAAKEVVAEKIIGTVLDFITATSYLLIIVISLPLIAGLISVVAVGMFWWLARLSQVQARCQAGETLTQARQRGYLTEMLYGIRTIKTESVEGHLFNRWMKQLKQETLWTFYRQRVLVRSEVIQVCAQQVVAATILLWGGQRVMHEQMSLGFLFAYLQVASGFLSSVTGLSNAYSAFVTLRPRTVKVDEVLQVAPEPRSLVPVPSATPGPIIMEDVWFRYTPDGPWVLRGYHLRLEAGEKLEILGSSGVGKSTVLRLLAGLYQPEFGRIAIANLAPRDLQGQILYMPQFVQLYSGSILENLRLLSGGGSFEEIISASMRTELHDWIETLPMKYHTVLPQGAFTLSGGQRQLIALSAAIASRKPIVLLDEATANLDPRMVAKLAQLLWDMDWTLVSVNHRSGPKFFNAPARISLI